MRKRKDEAPKENPEGAIKFPLTNEAVASHEVNKPDRGHHGGRKQRCQIKYPQPLTSPTGRRLERISHDKPQSSRRQRNARADEKGICEGPQVVSRKNAFPGALYRYPDQFPGGPQKPRGQKKDEYRQPSRSQPPRHAAPQVRQALSGSVTAKSAFSVNSGVTASERLTSAVMTVV